MARPHWADYGRRMTPVHPSSLRTARSSLTLAVPLLRAMVSELDGWRRRALAFAAGGASVLAMAPFFAFPVLWLTLPILVWLIEAEPVQTPEEDLAGPGARWLWLRHPAWRGAEAGWWFGFGYFFAGLIWIGEAFLVEVNVFSALLPVTVSGLPALLALFWGVAAGIAALPKVSTGTRVLVLAVTLPLAEYLRGHIFTGFPWNVIGYALTHPLPLAQSAAFVGIYGLSIAAVLIFGLPLVMAAGAAEGRKGRALRLAALATGLVPLLLLLGLGQWRLSGPPEAPLAGVRVRIVQPSILQSEKWRPEHQERIFEEHMALSVTAPSGARDDLAGITHVIWPEAAMPFLPLDYPVVTERIGRMLTASSVLIAGGLRAEYAGEGPARRRSSVFNSILVFAHGGTLAGVYDKIHLVPGGEYIPFRPLLEAIGLGSIARMRGGFDAGPSPRPLLALPGLPPIGPLVCYEAIFPAVVVQGTQRPGVLVNLTNDGWFGNSTGPRQHFHQARIRAVEEGLPLLRSANNGISAAFDAYGRLLGSLDMNVKGTLDVDLTPALSPPPYARYGDFAFFAGIGGMVLLLLWRRQ
ncbi:MAG: apolipoprotein N-acyltransferase [Hyphomicrobiaceae bacterium]|nr:apolipoprotein N-acyltransferase [Hyphomicrobiaceae bacterium]